MADYCLEEFLQIHESQLKASGVPEVFWPRLYEKLKAEELDAGDAFQIVVEQNEQEGTSSWSVHTIKDIVATDPNNIYLIDHAWTFRPNSARKTLTDFPVLKERLMKVFDISEEDFGDGLSCSDYVGSESGEAAKPEEKEPNKIGAQNGDDASSDIGEDSATPVDDKIIGAILDKIWLYAQTYTVKVRQSTIDESDLPVWYVPDEFGMRIGHSRDPNFRVVPFFYVFQNMSFSLLFPIKDVEEQGEVTRLYVENQLFRAHPEWYDVLMHPWEPVDASARPITFAPKDDNYFQSGRIPDELPSTFEQENVPPKPANRKLKVFATHAQLFEGLKHIEVDFVDDPFTADVVWMREHFHDFKSLAEKNPGALINQFPYESVLTVKDLLAASVQAAYGSNALNEETLAYLPDWLPVTFNLNIELPQFVSYFQRREQRNMDNTWIVKPWNLARGLDTHVTRNLNCIIRLAESGPKIVSKYIERPVLFRRPDSGNLVKFDLRYIVLLRSLQPLEIAIYNKFWIRFAINEFSLNNLDDIFTHLTVFNYAAKDKVLEMKCEEFIDQIEKLYPALHWQAVEKKVNQVLVDVFKTVSSNPAPRGLVPNKQSRAMYGIDVMLHWNDDEQKDVGVSFIEANFMPDCERACKMSTIIPDWNVAHLLNSATIEGKYVRLEKLDPEKHGADLWLAYCGPNCDPSQYDGLKYGPFSTRESFDEWLAEISSSRRHRCYATINLQNSKAEGFNCYVSIDPDNGTIEVGFHYGQCMQRTTRSTEATFLLINNAFLLGYRRVEARTSVNNVASIRNLERMGFRHEASCRQKQIMKGAAVDTSFFSILSTEWLPIKGACIKWLSDDNQTDGVQKKSLSLIFTALKNRQKTAEAFNSSFER